MHQVRVNVKCSINKANIRKETRNGREVLIVPSATMPDNVVMNGIMYPAEEIAKSFATLERTPAPLGHPVINGAFVSARDPEAINGFWVGAWNEGVERKDGRVFLNKVIDVKAAEATEGGKKVLEAINKGSPIHTSTGILLEAEDAPEGEKAFKRIARNMLFDHDAILLDQPGAATPEQGVGMMVNGQQIEVINSAMSEAESEIDWAGQHLLRALQRQRDATMWERVKTTVLDALTGGGGATASTTQQEGTMPPKIEEEVAGLAQRVASLEGSFKEAGDKTVTAINDALAKVLAPLTEQVQSLTAANTAKADAEKAVLIKAVVEAGLLSEETAKTMSINALTELRGKITLPAAPLAGHYVPNSGTKDEWTDHDLNANIEVKK